MKRSKMVFQRTLDIQPLTALITRYAGILDRAHHGWRVRQSDVRQGLFACAESAQGFGRPGSHDAGWDDIPAHIEEAALLVSMGAWAVGHDYRRKRVAVVKQLSPAAEALNTSLPIECRRAIEPAICFAYAVYGSIMKGELTDSSSEFDAVQRTARSRGMYRTLASAAFASCRAGLAFDDHSLDEAAQPFA